MRSLLLRIYDRLVLARPLAALAVALAAIILFAWQIPLFKLDASGDSLVLENDTDLRYHRGITERYATRDVLVVTYTPHADIFSPASLAELKIIRDELSRLPGVESVTSILDVPLLLSSKIPLSELADQEKIKTLEKSTVDLAAAREEFLESPLYAGRLLSPDGKTTPLLLNLPIDKKYRALLKRRYELREKGYQDQLSPAEAQELEEVSRQYRAHLTSLTHTENRLVEAVRQIIDRHGGHPVFYLGGVPMIVSDMIAFIRKDLLIFGVGVSVFLIITLAIIFRKLRWVVLPIACCAATVLTMIGYLGMVDWRVTVISSNVISLMIILTMSLTIHIIERYLEVHAESPEANQRSLILESVRTIIVPCFYTTLTTMVAFISLLVSDIRPVMDFGMMMAMGLIFSFILVFVILPATLVLFKKDSSGAGEDFSNPITLRFAHFTTIHGKTILVVSLVLTLLSVIGITRLKVENRFIDYFRQHTEIYQGMSLIDRKLGGTTPLDIIIDFKMEEEEEDEFDDIDLMAELDMDEYISPWFTDVYTIEQIEKIHDFLVGLPQTGEVLSLATVTKIATRLNNNKPLDNFDLSLLNQKVPTDIKELLISPYVSEDITQARLTMRIVESDKNMSRGALMTKMRSFLVETMGFDDDQIHFTNMYILYNNMLQSLFRSQILTIGMVFLGIMAMFTILFRSLRLALIAALPNMLPVALILGSMGWFGISLDMMTITIASITIGIAVDDTIHYIHRFQREFPKDRNYHATMIRCHRSIGRAMYYTSITITIGFSILVLSNFIPTIYFGLFTGLAMMVALLADLTLLPQLLMVFKPLGPEGVPEHLAKNNTNQKE